MENTEETRPVRCVKCLTRFYLSNILRNASWRGDDPITRVVVLTLGLTVIIIGVLLPMMSTNTCRETPLCFSRAPVLGACYKANASAYLTAPARPPAGEFLILIIIVNNLTQENPRRWAWGFPANLTRSGALGLSALSVSAWPTGLPFPNSGIGPRE